MSDTIGYRIDRVIKELGIKKFQFADRIGVHQTYVSQIASDKKVPSDRVIRDICAAFPEISESWLRTGEGDMFLPKPEDDQALVSRLVEAYDGSPVLRALLTTYMQLDEPRRAVFEDFVERFSAALAEAKAAGTPPPDASAYIRERTAPAPDQQAQ